MDKNWNSIKMFQRAEKLVVITIVWVFAVSMLFQRCSHDVAHFSLLERVLLKIGLNGSFLWQHPLQLCAMKEKEEEKENGLWWGPDCASDVLITVKEETFVGEKFRTYPSNTFRMEFKIVLSSWPKNVKTRRDDRKACEPCGRKFGTEINFVHFSIILKLRN